MKGSEFARVGRVTPEKTLKIRGLKGNTVVAEDIALLKAVWQRPLNF